MLHLDAGLGRIFPGREFVLVGRPVKRGEFVRQFQLTKMLLHVTLGRWLRGNYPVGFSGRAFSFVTSEFNDMLIH